MNEIICKALTASNFVARSELDGIVRNDDKRPDGVTMTPWKRGRFLAWDATIPDTLASSHVGNTGRTAGSAATAAEAVKERKYSNLIQNFAFMPIAIETFGTYGPQARRFIQELGNHLKISTGDALALWDLFVRESQWQCNEETLRLLWPR